MQRVALIWTVLALVVTGCGGDDDETATEAAETTAPADVEKPSDEEQIEQVGAELATLFGRGDEAACALAVGVLGDSLACGIYADGSPTAFVRSFEGAEIEEIEIKGSKACATFDNGERVEFTREGEWGPSNLGGKDGCGKGF